MAGAAIIHSFPERQLLTVARSALAHLRQRHGCKGKALRDVAVAIRAVHVVLATMHEMGLMREPYILELTRNDLGGDIDLP